MQPVAAPGGEPAAAGDGNQIMSMSLKDRREIRKMRFTGSGEGGTDVNNLMGQLEEERKKKEERAARFGTETKESMDQKRKDRLERFKAEGSAPEGGESKEERDRKIAERRERFGGQPNPDGKMNRK